MNNKIDNKNRLSKSAMIILAVIGMAALLILVSVLHFLLWLAPFVIIAAFVYTIYMILKKQ